MDHQDFVGRLSTIDSMTFNPEYGTRYSIQGYTVDFTIGSFDSYPANKDELPRMIHKSSIQFETTGKFGIRRLDDPSEELERSDVGEVFVTEVKIHLPPYRHNQKEDIESILDLTDKFAIRYGATVLGQMTGPEDWGLRPHIHLVEEKCSVEDVLQVTRQSVEVFECLNPMTDEEILAEMS